MFTTLSAFDPAKPPVPSREGHRGAVGTAMALKPVELLCMAPSIAFDHFGAACESKFDAVTAMVALSRRVSPVKSIGFALTQRPPPTTLPPPTPTTIRPLTIPVLLLESLSELLRALRRAGSTNLTLAVDDGR